MKFLKKALSDIRQRKYIELYISLVASIVLLIAGLFPGTNSTAFSELILAILSLLIYGQISARHTEEKVEKQSKMIIEEVKSNSEKIIQELHNNYKPTGAFFVHNTNVNELRDLVVQSSKVLAWGTTFSSHIPFLEGSLKKGGLRSGVIMKFLLVKPSSSALRMAAFRTDDYDEETLNATLIANLNILSKLAKRTSAEQIQYRVVNYLGPYTMYAFDPELPTGLLMVHLSTFRGEDVLDRPTFRLTRRTYPDVFDYFISQFEAVWKEAEIYSPTALEEQYIPHE